MKDIKCCWAVETAADAHIIGCIRLVQRMLWLNSKYPVEVIITDKISQSSIELLQKYNIKFNQIKDDYCNIFHDISCLLLPIKLADYEFIYNLEPDMLPIKNIDYILEQAYNQVKDDSANIYSDNGQTGNLVFKPTKDADNLLAQLYQYYPNNTYYHVEHYLYMNLDKLSKFNFINLSSKIIKPKSDVLLHFPCGNKPWDSKCNNEIVMHYLTDDSRSFNIFVDNNYFQLLFFSWINIIMQESSNSVTMRQPNKTAKEILQRLLIDYKLNFNNF